MFVFCTSVQTQDMLGYQQDGFGNKVRYSLNQKCLPVYPDKIISFHWAGLYWSVLRAFGSVLYIKQTNKKTLALALACPTFIVQHFFPENTHF